MTVKTRTLRNAAICRVGRWKGISGVEDITREKLQAAVDAYQDPEVSRPRLKIGHISSMNTALGDGAPAFGWVENPRMDGDTLRADLVDIPEKLAGLIGRAYRNGSIEGRHNLTTPSGKHYPFALKAFAILGNSDPAVKGMDPLPRIEDLDELADLYASESPDGIDDDTTQESVSVLMLGELDDSLIPTPHVTRGDTGNNDPGEARGETQEEPVMAYPKSTLDALGLPEDATEEQVNAAIAARAEKPAEPVEDPKPAADEKPEDKPADGEVALSDLLEEYRGQVTALSEQVQTLRADKHARDVNDLMGEAQRTGRFGPAKAKQLVEKFGKDFAVLSEVVETYEPGTINVTETGADTALSAGPKDDELDAYLDRLFTKGA